jgi:hypothetical protein
MSRWQLTNKATHFATAAEGGQCLFLARSRTDLMRRFLRRWRKLTIHLRRIRWSTTRNLLSSPPPQPYRRSDPSCRLAPTNPSRLSPLDTFVRTVAATSSSTANPAAATTAPPSTATGCRMRRWCDHYALGWSVPGAGLSAPTCDPTGARTRMRGGPGDDSPESSFRAIGHVRYPPRLAPSDKAGAENTGQKITPSNRLGVKLPYSLKRLVCRTGSGGTGVRCAS